MNIDELIKKVVKLRIFYDRNLFTDSIRGTVIILTSAIHSFLVDLIRDEKSIRKDEVESLKKGKDAYNTFAKAINASLLLDIIEEHTANGLHSLRKLRNDLAHGVELMGDDDEVSKRIDDISNTLKAVPNEETKWAIHGIAIRLIHGICYDYAESKGWNRDDILAKWEPIRLQVMNETNQRDNDGGRPDDN